MTVLDIVVDIGCFIFGLTAGLVLQTWFVQRGEK